VTRRAGLTLLEVVAAGGVLAVVTLALLSVLVSGESVTALSAERTQAALRAASELEATAALRWDQLPARDGATFEVEVEVAPDRTARLRAPEGGPAGSIAVRPTAQADLRQLVVTVRWRAASGPTSVTLATLVARR
jgi:type II secretory pathway pseudopilin PulG